MRKFWKGFSTLALIILVSVGASYGTYYYLDKTSDKNHFEVSEYGESFNQSNNRFSSISSNGGYPDFVKAAEISVNAVVHIKSTITPANNQNERRRQYIDPFEYFFGYGDRGFSQRQQQPIVGFGSGVIISKDGYIITNNHVIDKATDVEVILNDKSKYVAKLVGTDPKTDIALLKIDGSDLPYLPFGDSDKLRVGEWVLAVGNPFDLTSTVTAGIVSAKGREGIGRSNGDLTIQSFIQTDAAINPGNSGGALVDTKGLLVGINTAIYSQTGNFTGYGFAVPISIAGKVAADLKEFGVVQRAALGIVILDLDLIRNNNPELLKNIATKEGVYVYKFAYNSSARDAGMEGGDIIIAVNNIKVNNVSELQEQINRYRPGDRVSIKFLRDNEQKELAIVLNNPLID